MSMTTERRRDDDDADATQTTTMPEHRQAYTTRVGHGPFPTELQNEVQDLEESPRQHLSRAVKGEAQTAPDNYKNGKMQKHNFKCVASGPDSPPGTRQD